MNVHVLDPARDHTLRTLDAAPAGEPVDRERQAHLLAAVMASDPTAEWGTALDAAAPGLAPGSSAGWIPPRRHPWRRVALATGATAALAAGVVALPGLGSSYAYASWTATPTSVAPGELARVVDACRDQLGTIGGAPAPSVRASDLAVRLAERRGTWVAVLLATTTPNAYEWTASCLAELPAGSGADPTHVSSAAAGGGGFAAPTGRDFTEGAIAEFGKDTGLFGSGRQEPASVTSGRVGSDVVGVTIHSQGVSVQASVKDGTYAAWWPGLAFNPADAGLPSGEGGPRPTITYDVTLRDGTVLKNAAPWRPTSPGPAGSESRSAGAPASTS